MPERALQHSATIQVVSAAYSGCGRAAVMAVSLIERLENKKTTIIFENENKTIAANADSGNVTVEIKERRTRQGGQEWPRGKE